MQKIASLQKSMKKTKTLEESILLLKQSAKNSPISVRKILDILSGKGRYVILVLLSLPFCQPIQIPGFSTPFGLAIAFLGLRIAFGKQVWLPSTLLSKKISSSTMQKLTKNALWLIQKITPLVHPRLTVLCEARGMNRFNGLLMAFLGLALALPLPIPFSNLIAAWAIFLIALGLSEDDGLFILFGYLLSILTLGFFIAMAFSVKLFF